MPTRSINTKNIKKAEPIALAKNAPNVLGRVPVRYLYGPTYPNITINIGTVIKNTTLPTMELSCDFDILSPNV